MYNCWGLVTINYKHVWLKGWDCGVRSSDGLTCFIAEIDSRTKYYLSNEELSYSEEKPE